MDDKVDALKHTLVALERELTGFEIDIAWRRPDIKRSAAIRVLCEAFQQQMDGHRPAAKEL
jgi:hypothetical protein